MFQVDRSENRLVRLGRRRFSDLGLREREHLQEWLAQTPEALGEELLIIQKEFDGFADTRERLDLLALDKEGRLVVIENKLDDSGRDVVWQALKYAAYCSNLTQKDIRDIYQEYLDRSFDGQDAEAKLREFLGVEDLDEVVLNRGDEQRLVLIAASFRKEATAAVLWLLGHGVRAQCFRVVPYSFGDDVFVDLRQIIPTPEAADYMIGMAAKDSEQKAVEGARRSRHKLRRAFWTQVLETLRERHTTALFQNVNPSEQYWLSCSTGLPACDYTLVFAKREVRVEVELKRSEKGENKWLFDRLEQERGDVETRFGDGLTWLRMDDNKASRIVFARDFDGFNESNWPDMVAWLCEHVVRLEQAFSALLARLNGELKSGIDRDAGRGTAEEGLAAAD